MAPTVSSIVAAAKEEMAAEAVKTPKEGLEQYIERMCKETPDAVITPGDFPDTTNLPGFELLNLGICQLLGMKWGMLAPLKEYREKYFEPFIVNTQVGHHIVRGFNRIEWAELQRRIIQESKDRYQLHQTQGSDTKWADTEVELHTEEMIVCAGTVSPQYDKTEVRKLPSGVVSYLAKAILQSCGYEQQSMPPIPLR